MIYKASIALHFAPTKWKSSKVVYIPKVGKDDYAQAKSCRPISLINYPPKRSRKIKCMGGRHSPRRKPTTWISKRQKHGNSHIKYNTQN